MRQGQVQPLSVTTGLYGRPVEGTSGGMVSGLSWITGSGIAASAALLTAVADAAIAEPPMKLRLERVAAMSMSLGVAARRRWERSRRRGRRSRRADQRHVELGISQP